MANVRPFTFPAKKDNFDLSLDETATQSPPEYYQLSGRAAEVSDEEEDDEDNGKDTSP